MVISRWQDVTQLPAGEPDGAANTRRRIDALTPAMSRLAAGTLNAWTLLAPGAAARREALGWLATLTSGGWP